MSIESWVRRVILRGTNGNEMSVNSDGSLPVTIQGANSTGGALGVDVQQSEIIQPIDIQSRLQTTIQTHNAVSVPATTGLSVGSWIDCDGFDKIAFTFLNDATTASSGDVQWSNDGSNQHGLDLSVIPTGTTKYKNGITDIKARYCRLVLGNTDASAHTMSAWAYLKA